MTNITLSIDNKTREQMKKHSEIKWSEFVRKAIKKRLQELESIENSEGVFTMLASQEVLKKDWDNAEDERWNSV